MNKRYYEHTLPIIRGSLSNTYILQRYAINLSECVFSIDSVYKYIDFTYLNRCRFRYAAL